MHHLSNLVAAVAGGQPEDWKFNCEEDWVTGEGDLTSLAPLHGNDVFSITLLENATLGLTARVEYDQQDYVYVDVSDGVSFSGPLEDEVHVLAISGEFMAARQCFLNEQMSAIGISP